MSQRPYKTIRAVVECRVPPDITEKDLVWKLKEILRWPIQISRVKGRRDSLVKVDVKQFSRVSAYKRSIDNAEGTLAEMFSMFFFPRWRGRK